MKKEPDMSETIISLAVRVNAGEFGEGDDLKAKLAELGHDPEKVIREAEWLAKASAAERLCDLGYDPEQGYDTIFGE